MNCKQLAISIQDDFEDDVWEVFHSKDSLSVIMRFDSDKWPEVRKFIKDNKDKDLDIELWVERREKR